ncbi:MAG: DUF58 domain-containing protein [Flavobacteriales bacterium]|nr:DUF58 domain-containing protein [Flavobacteriales bacterium]
MQNLHLTQRFFIALGILIGLTGLCYALEFLLPLVQIFAMIVGVLTLTEVISLFGQKNRFEVARETGKLFSLGDENPVVLTIRNAHSFRVNLSVYDELPVQFQERDFQMNLSLSPREERKLRYNLRPLTRGEYAFHQVNLIATSQIGLVARRHRLGEKTIVPVYPSIIQMKKYELTAFARISTYEGIKKVRRLGHSYEFEKIKKYAEGDDIRSINWKATGRRNQLMVNQYEDERAQQVYSIIDKSRSMRMPFNGLSLLDYSINTSLVISNIALKKHDKAGLITFSNKIGSTLKAEHSRNQLKKILNALYNEQEQPLEANYDLLYRAVKNVIKSRSLIFLYLNFESTYAMERALPILKKINHLHVLVVMIFENTELIEYSEKDVEFIQDIYTQTVAQKLIREKKEMVNKLNKYGIQTILTRPEDLSINTVNKYLELKSRGMI